MGLNDRPGNRADSPSLCACPRRIENGSVVMDIAQHTNCPLHGKHPWSGRRERTLSITVGGWGGTYASGNRTCWRLCLGWVAVTFFRGEFTDALRAMLDA